MTLMLHVNAKEIDYDSLRQIEPPPATPTHTPLAHYRLVDLVKGVVAMYGHVVTAEHFGVTEDGMRFFALFSLKSTYTDYEDTVICRGANDKAWPIGVGFGSRCFCCDNMAFIADHQVKRRHTANLKRDLPGLIGEMIEPLTLVREQQHRTFERYKGTLLTDQQADAAIMSMWRNDIINVNRIPEVAREYDEPSFDEFKETRSAWRLFNAATYALTGRVTDNPKATPKLFGVIDGVCQEAYDLQQL